MKTTFNRKFKNIYCVSGFTLIELMVTVSVLAILAGLSVPGMASMLALGPFNPLSMFLALASLFGMFPMFLSLQLLLPLLVNGFTNHRQLLFRCWIEFGPTLVQPVG